MVTTTPIPVGPFTFDVDFHGDESGIPVLALHGFPTTAASWQEVADQLVPRGVRLIAPLQRGYSAGARPTETEDYATETLARDAVGLLDALGLEKVHLLGHDWGSAVAWTAAAHHPERFHTLTAVSVPHPAAYNWALTNSPDARERASYIQLFQQVGKAEDLLLEDDARRLRAVFADAVDPSIADRYLPILGQRDALTAALQWYRARSTFADLPAVRIPTTFIWSNGDVAIGRAGAERCGEWVEADYRFIELDGSHWVPEDSPAAVANAVFDRISIAQA